MRTVAALSNQEGSSIAACTWLFGDHDHRRIAERIAGLGLEGVEVLADIDRYSPSFLRDIYANAGLRVVSLTPDNVDIAHPDNRQRQAALGYYKRLIEFAAELGCPRVTCHEVVGRVKLVDTLEAEWQRLVKSCRYLAAIAQKHGITLVFEPLHRGLANLIHRVDEVCRLMDAVAHPALSVMLDTYHLCLEDPDPAAAIRFCGARVAAVQLADTDRAPLGGGTAPLENCCKALAGIGFNGPLILECSSQLLSPSLMPRTVDYGRVEQDLRISLQWLAQAQLTS